MLLHVNYTLMKPIKNILKISIGELEDITEETCQKVEQKKHKDGNFNKKIKLEDQSRWYQSFHQEKIEKTEGGN